VALLLLTTGPLYRVRTWWSYEDPLATDPLVVMIYAATGVAAAAWLVRRRALPRSAAIVGAGLVVGWLLLGTLWSSAWGTTLREALQIASALAVGVAARLALGARWFAGALWAALHVGLLWSFVAIQLGQPGTQDERGDWAGVFFNRNSLALIAALGLLSGGAILVDSWGRRTRPVAVDAVVVVMMLVDARLLLGSAARTPWVALLAALVVGAVVLAGHRLVGDGRSAFVVAASGGLVIAAAGAVAWLTRHSWLDDLGRSSDLTGRVDVWDTVIGRWRQRPVVGDGYLAAWDDAGFVAGVDEASGHVLSSAHNSFLEVLLGGGAIGLLFFVAFVAVLWTRSVSAALAEPVLARLSVVMVLTYVVVQNLTETLFVGNHVTVALLGVVAVSASAART
jgi:O-antigen ligase